MWSIPNSKLYPRRIILNTSYTVVWLPTGLLATAPKQRQFAQLQGLSSMLSKIKQLMWLGSTIYKIVQGNCLNLSVRDAILHLQRKWHKLAILILVVWR
jgi:hypothetical protein